MLILLVLGGIGSALSNGDDDPAAASTPQSSATARASSTPREAWEVIPTRRRAAFLSYLRRLDPGLTPTSAGAKARPLRRAVDVCYDVYAGKPLPTVLANTARRFDGGQASVPQGSAKARRILAAAKRWICSSRELRAHYNKLHP
ncbi:hypothetical protein [Actinomadura terrae]|uniref:hypothetical protein n=1 Tax=Actinomadura terrae TaxID=604353 RepID=UPI001FA6B65A|nr:hypothetical protein [Actinomadura terrae]